MTENSNTPILLTVDGNFDLKLDIIDLQVIGLTDEEIEGYLEFFDRVSEETADDEF